MEINNEQRNENNNLTVDFTELEDRFRCQLISQLRERLGSSISPSKSRIIQLGAGITGLIICCTFDMQWETAEVQLFINRSFGGEPVKNRIWNKRVFDILFRSKIAIEQSYGQGLVWDRSDNHSRCVVKHIFTNLKLQDQAAWEEIQQQLVASIRSLRSAISPYLSSVRNEAPIRFHYSPPIESQEQPNNKNFFQRMFS